MYLGILNAQFVGFGKLYSFKIDHFLLFLLFLNVSILVSNWSNVKITSSFQMGLYLGQ